jgi:hypothetical protein
MSAHLQALTHGIPGLKFVHALVWAALLVGVSSQLHSLTRKARKSPVKAAQSGNPALKVAGVGGGNDAATSCRPYE